MIDLSHSRFFISQLDSRPQMVLSSDKISSMHEPIVLLRLALANQGADKEVTIELTKTELDRLLGTFGSIQSTLDRLKA